MSLITKERVDILETYRKEKSRKAMLKIIHEMEDADAKEYQLEVEANNKTRKEVLWVGIVGLIIVSIIFYFNR